MNLRPEVKDRSILDDLLEGSSDLADLSADKQTE